MVLHVRLAESNKGSKERQGATLGVRFIEVYMSVKRESTVLIYLFIYLLNYLFIFFISFFFVTRPSFQSTENAEKSDVLIH